MRNTAKFFLVCLVLIFILSFLPASSEVRAERVTFIVNTTGDGLTYVDVDLTDDQCRTQFGNCSLRAAIQQSHPDYMDAGVSIGFDLPYPYKITLASSLPYIYANIENNNTYRVTIDGNNYLGLMFFGLQSTTISGLQLQNFAVTAIYDYLMGNDVITNNVIINNRSVGISVWAIADDPGILTITNNYIGYDPMNGSAGNASHGIDINIDSGDHSGSTVFIGEGNILTGNTISGNGGSGIRVNNENNSQVVIKGNYIGTSDMGTIAVGNRSDGIYVPKSLGSLIIGGDGQGNLISGNLDNGIDIYESTSQTLIQGNYLSTNVDQDSYLPNNGIDIKAFDSSYITIGGATKNLGNVILQGLKITKNQYQNSNVVIKNNFVGLTRTGFIRPTFSTTAGIEVNNIVGVSEISFNEITGFRKGIIVGTNSNVPILNNQIYNNSVMGIDLNNDGVTDNDNPPDADTGPNGLQNFPIISNVEVTEIGTAKQVMFDLTLGSTPYTYYRIQVFSSPFCSPSGYGEGKQILSINPDPFLIRTGSDGYYEFNELLAFYPSSIIGPCLTATATMLEDTTFKPIATSEFSQGVMAWEPEFMLFLPLILK